MNMHAILRTAFTLAALCAAATPGAASADCPATTRGAEAVKRALLALDADAFASLVDVPGLSARVVQGLPEDDELVGVVPVAFERSRAQMAHNLVVSLGMGGSHVVEQPGAGKRVLLRKAGPDIGGGVDYLEFVLSRDGCVVDWRSLALGTEASGLMRQNLLLTRDDANLLAKLFGVQRFDARQGRQLLALGEALRVGNAAAAVEALDGMKSLARASFELTMLRVGLLANDHTAPAYREALADLAERFGDDERTQFMLVDHYFFVADFAKALRAVERLQQRVGRDEENELLRGTMLKQMGRNDDALDAYRAMVAMAPGKATAHGVLVAHLAEMGRSADAVAAMKAAAAHEVTFDEAVMQREPAYAQLLASDEYAAYRAERPTD